MDYETQIRNFNDEIVSLSKDISRIQDNIDDVHQMVKEYRLLKNMLLCIIALGITAHIFGFFVSAVLFVVAYQISQVKKNAQEHEEKLNNEYNQKILEIVYCNIKKNNLQKVWQKDKDTIKMTEEQQAEYHNNLSYADRLVSLLQKKLELQQYQVPAIEESNPLRKERK